MVLIRLFSIIVTVFGIMTVISGSVVLFPNDIIQKLAGNYVEFVVWFNLLSGFVYILTGFGLWKGKKWAVSVSVLLTISIAIILIIFSFHVVQDGAFEVRTFYALTFRMVLWLAVSIISYKAVIKGTLAKNEV